MNDDQPDEGLKELLDAYRAKRQAGVDLLNVHRALFGNDVLTLIKDQPDVPRRPWCGVVLHPSPHRVGKVQRTYFDQWGFSGHEVFDTFEEAAGDAYLCGYRRPAPTFLDEICMTDEFEAGNRWASLPDDQKWNTNINSILEQIRQQKAGNNEQGISKGHSNDQN